MFNFKKSNTLADKKNHKIKLQLKLTDFGKQNIIASTEIADRINLLPTFHLDKLKEILYDPERFTPQIINNSLEDLHADAQGVFIQSHRMIVIYQIYNKQQFYHVLFHELGHHVYFQIIGQALKMKWVKDICRNDKFISKYASRNAAEDFAESYAAYLLEPDELKKIKLKYNFMRKHVFKDLAQIMQNNSLDYRA